MSTLLDVDLLLYTGVLLTLSYLIYRYARYSKWESTDAGRAFMSTKVCLLALSLYGLLSLAIPAEEWRDIARPLVVGSILVSLLYSVRVLVRWQGGFRQRRHDRH